MAVSDDYLIYIQDLLSGLGHLRVKRMFGGAGLYCNDIFFAIVTDDTLYFKVDDQTRTDYKRHHAPRFTYRSKDRDVSLDYYEVPAAILEDDEALNAWAKAAIQVALRKGK